MCIDYRYITFQIITNLNKQQLRLYLSPNNIPGR